MKTRILRKFSFLQYLSGIKQLPKIIKGLHDINREFKKGIIKDTITISDANLNIFKLAFKKFIWHQPNEINIAKLFINCEIYPLSLMKKKIVQEPILICVEKNDIDRMKVFLSHYRAIGIKKFVIVDNQSDDGTISYLKEQNDIDLYTCKTKYTTQNREAWINRIIAHYGFNKWYIVVDSDELFVYENFETFSIQQFIDKVKNKCDRRVLSLMIDMYSEDGIFSTNNNNGIYDKYCYFDFDTYVHKKNFKYEELRGGPRERIFNNDNDIKVKPKFLLTKYPVFYFEKGDIQGFSHFQFPYRPNYDLKCFSYLLHYKFLYNDFEKYKKRVEDGNYASGSMEYKTYLSYYYDGKSINFMSKHSKKYVNSDSLKQIKIKDNN